MMPLRYVRCRLALDGQWSWLLSASLLFGFGLVGRRVFIDVVLFRCYVCCRHFFSRKIAPAVGLEPTTTRLRALRSAG